MRRIVNHRDAAQNAPDQNAPENPEQLAEIWSCFAQPLLAALRIRRIEAAMLRLFASGEIDGTLHICIGQELLPVFLAGQLRPMDYILSNHRGHGHFLAATGDEQGLIAELMGRQGGAAGGYGGSQHLRGPRFLSNGVQGGMTAISLGLAHGLRDQGGIAVCFIGDGTLGQGLVYESLNLASLWHLPVLMVVEDNGIAQSTPAAQHMAGTVEGRAAAFGWAYRHACSDDPFALLDACRASVDGLRATGQATLLHVRTHRLGSHSKGDETRPQAQVEAAKQADLLNRLEQAGLIDEAMLAGIDREIEALIEEIRTWPRLSAVPAFQPLQPRGETTETALPPVSGSGASQINAALAGLFETMPDLMMVGEDIEDGPPDHATAYGGAFKISRGLSTRFPGRVVNGPISEAALTGFAIGRALGGAPTVAEIMFGDFTTLIVDQLLQHAAKFPTMFGSEMELPLVIRTPMGGGRGYGPTHSQSLERLFLGWQNLTVAALNRRIDPAAFYRAAFTPPCRATLLLEHKALYARTMSPELPPGYEAVMTADPFPTLIIRPRRHRAACTVATYGLGLDLVEACLLNLALDHEIFLDVIVPSRLSPLDLSPILTSARRTGSILTVEEGPSFAAFGAEIIAGVAEAGVALRGVRRLGNNTILPAALTAEAALLPSADKVIAACLELARHD